MRYKLCKPIWAKKKIDGKPNPKFLKDIPGIDNEEGEFSEQEIKEKNEAGFNVYFFPNYPSEMPEEVKYARGEHIDVFNFVFVDMDLKQGIYKTKEEFYDRLAKFPLLPTQVNDSGNGVHAYWAVDNLTRETFILLQRVLIKEFNTDPAIWTVKQIMRVPDTFNTKDPENYKKVKTVSSTGESYMAEDLFKVLPQPDAEDEKKMRRHLNMIDGIGTVEDMEDLNIEEVPEQFIKDMDKDQELNGLFNDPTGFKGDRSSADMSLANKLYSKGYNRKDAEKIIQNTQKARSRDAASRVQYARDTVEKVFKDRPKFIVPNLLEMTQMKDGYKLGDPINGPTFMDAAEEPWRRGEVLGLVGGTGMGKTTLTLKLLREILMNNDQGIVIFFSLEMSTAQVKRRWERLTKNQPDITRRVFVVSNDAVDGNINNIGLQEIVYYTRDISRSEGQDVICVVIDHMGELSNLVDTRKEPSFNAKGDIEGGFDPVKKLGYQNLCSKVKDLAKILNTFVIMQSQTRREYDTVGDVTLYKDAAFGASNFEKMVHWMITFWQPLMRLYSETSLRVTAWQYCKIREQSDNDRVKVLDPRLLNFDMKTGDYRALTPAEEEEFNLLYPKAVAKRKNAEKSGAEMVYKNSPQDIIRRVKQFSEIKGGKL